MAETSIQNVAGAGSGELSVRARLILAGRTEFSEKGFSGASVRMICKRAETSSNMIHHYFGSKQGLYDEILSSFSERVFMVPIRIIREPAKSREHLEARLEFFVEETLEALIAQADIYRLVVREQVIFEPFVKYNEQLVKFLDASKKSGFVREDLDSEMLTGLILDRLGNQVLFAPWMEEIDGKSVLSDETYKRRWLKANTDLILHGIVSTK
ncbi:MAG: AcrR family transcriptional regulator [Paracoccaceae bacterium]|jgi:AcrR family transcriptional regulator